MEDLRQPVTHVGRVDAVEKPDRGNNHGAHAQRDTQGQPGGVLGDHGGPTLPEHPPSRRPIQEHGEGREGRGHQQRRGLEGEAAQRDPRQGEQDKLKGKGDARADRVDRGEQGRRRNQEGEHAGHGVRVTQQATKPAPPSLRRFCAPTAGVVGGGGIGLVPGILGRATASQLTQVDDSVTHGRHERGIVGDGHQGDPAGEGSAQQADEAQPRSPVLPEGGLIQDEQLGGADERGCHGEAPLLASRQGHGVGAGQGG